MIFAFRTTTFDHNRHYVWGIQEAAVSHENLPAADFDRYRTWKGWQHLFVCSGEMDRYFAGEFAGIALNGTQILEIGFGQGAMLQWFRQQGATVVGCELSPSLCKAGLQHGYDVRCGDFKAVVDSSRERFDLIVAFDVLEHIAPNQTLDFFVAASRLMKIGAKLIVRVPNGQSPLGNIYQNGDITHVNVLSFSKFEQIALATGLNLDSCTHAFRPINSSRPIADRLKFYTRDLIALAIGKVYGFEAITFDPNIVARFSLSKEP